jgi:hypothetical protein
LDALAESLLVELVHSYLPQGCDSDSISISV